MLRSWLSYCAGVAVCFSAADALSNPLTFTIDSQKSQISLAIEESDGTPISSAQTPGSDTTSLSGTAQVDVSPSTIQFLPSAGASFALQSAPQSPLANGVPGTSPAQYGLDISVPGFGGGTMAARQLLGQVTSDVLPVASGNFDASQLSLQFLTGAADYNLTLLGQNFLGSADITAPVTNQQSSGTLFATGDVYTITIPILAVGSYDVDGLTVLGVYTGTIVATATVPEPETLTLLSIAASLMLFRRKGHC